jgi:hypothetical protein
MPRNTPLPDPLAGWGKENRTAPKPAHQQGPISPPTLYDDVRTPSAPASAAVPLHRPSAQRETIPEASNEDAIPPEEKSQYPHSDTRWPLPHTSTPYLLRLDPDSSSSETRPIVYNLIYQNSDPSAELVWKGEIVSEATAAYAEKGIAGPTQAVLGDKAGKTKAEIRREREKALEEEAGPALMSILHAKNTAKLEEVSKGPRGTIWNLHSWHLHVWRAIEVVQKARGSVRLGEERLVFEVFGVRRKKREKNMLLVSTKMDSLGVAGWERDVECYV